MTAPRRRQYAMAGPDCPSGADHGPMVKLPSGRWWCPHSEHTRIIPPATTAKAATFTDAEAGL